MNRVQTLRSSITGDRPVIGTRQPGELYVNWADQTIGTIDPTKTAMDLIAVRYWNVQANYAVGAHVIYNGVMYRALAPIVAGPFDPSQWGAIVVGGVGEAPIDGQIYGRENGSWTVVTSGPGGSFLPLSGGTLTGDLTVAEATGNSSIIISKAAAGNLSQLEGRTGGILRWDLTIGDQTLETGGNAGSNFSINAFADGPADGTGQTPLISTPLFINRASGLIRVVGDPTDTFGVATKHYVDIGATTVLREAPNDGQLYGRKSLGWTVVPTGTGGAFLPLSGGTLTGDLTVAEPTGDSSIIINKFASGHLSQLEGRTGGGTRWDVTLGDQTPETGGNVGSDFSINAFADGTGQTALNYVALFIKRSTGQVSVAHDPLPGVPFGVATRQYVDSTSTAVLREAPTDGQIYGRQSATWVVVPTSGGPGGSYLPLTGGTLTGDLTVAEPTGNSNILIKKVGSTHLAQLEGWSGANVRWDVTLGDQTAESGSNAGSDFSINAFADSAVDGSAPLFTALFIKRSTGRISVLEPTLSQHVATKNYVDTAIAGVSSGGFNNNLIDNGDMSIAQRGAGSVVAVSSGTTIQVDRWEAVATASRFSIGKNFNGLAPPTGFANFLGVRCTSATAAGSTDLFVLQQRIEGVTLNGFNWGTAAAAGQPVMLSFWACTSRAGPLTFSGSLTNSTGPSTAPNRSYVFTFTIPAANTPTRFTIPIPGDTAGTWINTGQASGMFLIFNLGSGSTNCTTPGSWVAGDFVGSTGSAGIIGNNNANFYVTGVKLEPSATATPFAFDPPAVRMARCQRYYQVLGSVICDGYGGQGFMTMGHTFVCEMRAPPSPSVVGSVTYSNANSFQFFGTTSNTVTVGANTTGTGESGASAAVQLTAESF